MRNFGLIYWYEVRKITERKFLRLAFTIIIIINLLINLHSIIDYSVGSRGADMMVINQYGRQILDRKAFLKGEVIFRYVDDAGNVMEEKVGPMEYICRVREYAMRWSGTVLDDRTIGELQDFLDQYNYHDGKGYSYGWSFQNFYWVWESIRLIGLNPQSADVSEVFIRQHMEEQWKYIMDAEQLTKAERAFWDTCPKPEIPLKMAYVPGFDNLINKTKMTHIMLLLFVIISLCSSFSEDRERRLSQISQATSKGSSAAVFARLCAGETIVLAAGAALYLSSALVQFGIFGRDGFAAPLQLISGMVWSRMKVTAGQGAMLLCACSMLICLMMGAITMLLSQLMQSSIAALAGCNTFLLVTLAYDYQIFCENRVLSQIVSYLPVHRIGPEFLYDERMVPLAGRLVPAIPFSIGIYLLITFLSLAACAGLAILGRQDKR